VFTVRLRLSDAHKTTLFFIFFPPSSFTFFAPWRLNTYQGSTKKNKRHQRNLTTEKKKKNLISFQTDTHTERKWCAVSNLSDDPAAEKKVGGAWWLLLDA
jgi:3'-phosphoadenosine 5'-phosphosulfate (PAPS) 3'-phosphatase